MADDIIGSVAVEVVPNASRFVQDFKTRVLPGMRQVGTELGNVAGTAAGKALADRIRDGLGEGFRRSDPAGQGSKQGDQFGGAFARTVKARLDAALRDLPKAKIDGDTTGAQRKLAELRARLAELSAKKIGVDISDKEALAKLAALKLELDTLASKSKDIRLNVDARSASAELGKLRGELEAVIRAGTATGSSIGAGGGPGGGLLIGGAIAAGLALVGPAAGTATAGLAGLVGVAGTAVLAVKGVKQEMKDGTVAGLEFQDQFDKIKATVGGLAATAAHGVEGGVLDALGKLNAEAPHLNPLVASISAHLGATASITADTLISALRTASPLLEDGGRYAEELAQKLDDAANSQRFKDFIGYARQELPIVGRDMADFAHATVDVAVALQPVGGELLSILDTGAKVVDVLAKIAHASTHVPTNYKSGGAKPDTVHQVNDAIARGVERFFSPDQGPKASTKPKTPPAPDKAAAAAVLQQSIAQNQLNVSLAAGYTQALAFTTADQAANQAIAQQATSLAATTRQMYLQSDAGGLLKQQLDALSGKQLDAAQAQNQFEQSLVSGAQGIQAQKKAHDKLATSLGLTKDGFTGVAQAQIQNRASLLGQVQAAEASAEAFGSMDKSGEKTRQKLVDLRQQIIDNAKATGENVTEVTKFIDSVLKIPAKVPAYIDDNAAAVKARVDVLQNTLGHMVGPTLTVRTTGIDGAIQAIQSVVEYAANHAPVIHVVTRTQSGAFSGGQQAGEAKASGGWITGPGSQTSDSVLIRASRDEFVVRASQAVKNRGLLEAINTPGYADGGVVTLESTGGTAAAKKAASATRAAAKAAASLVTAQANIRFTTSLDLSKLTSTGTASAIAAAIRKLIVDVHTAAAKGAGSDSLIPTLQAENTQLGRLANERVGLANKIKTAAASLTAQRQASAQEAAQVEGGIGGVFNVTSLDSPAQFGTASPAALIQNLQVEARQVQNAATQLAQLRKLGLDKTLIQQLGEAGPGGFASIQSLSTATPAQIAQINALKATVNAASQAAGNQVAGSLYQAGIDSAVGYIRGLDSQLANVNKAASRLAATVVAQVKRSLGIRSPSLVMRQHGRFTGEGFALGIADRYGMVASSASGLANAAVQPAQFGGGLQLPAGLIQVNPSPNHSETAIGTAAGRFLASQFA